MGCCSLIVLSSVALGLCRSPTVLPTVEMLLCCSRTVLSNVALGCFLEACRPGLGFGAQTEGARDPRLGSPGRQGSSDTACGRGLANALLSFSTCAWPCAESAPGLLGILDPPCWPCRSLACLDLSTWACSMTCAAALNHVSYELRWRPASNDQDCLLKHLPTVWSTMLHAVPCPAACVTKRLRLWKVTVQMRPDAARVATQVPP